MLLKILICIALVMIQVLKIQGKTKEEFKEEYVKVIQGCSKENNLEVEDLKKLHDNKPSSVDEKCFFACCYKKSGMMDENGMLSVDGIKKIGEEIFKNDEKKMMLLDQYINQCSSVNMASVSDGAKGCDRAALMYECNDKAKTNELLMF